MKKALLIVTALCVMLTIMHGIPCTKADASGEELKLTLPLEGSWGPADDSQASFAYRLPQFETDSESALRINDYYQAIPAKIGEYASYLSVTSIDYEITHQDNRYLSVVLHLYAESGNGYSEEIAADVFALDGIYAGQPLTLSKLLGLEDMSQEETLHQTVCGLVWQIVEREMQNAESDYLGNLTQMDVYAALHPQTDFYLDENSNILFYIQSGSIAGEIAGVLTFPFAPSELLDVMGQ